MSEMSTGDTLLSVFGFMLPPNIKEFTMVDYLEFFAIIGMIVVLLIPLVKTKTFQKLFKKIEWLF